MARKTAKPDVHGDLPVLPFATMNKWLVWLEKNHTRDAGIWIRFAKKGNGIASVTYEEAREGALMYGWIDGQKGSWDEDWYLIRLTPRRSRSRWSKINRQIVEQLVKQKKMKPTGLAQVDAAKRDGRWDAAYDSPSTITVPVELQKLLKTSVKAKKNFDGLSSANRYAFLYRIQNAKRPETKQRHIARTFEMLKKGDVFHPELRRKESKMAKKAPRKRKAQRKSIVARKTCAICLLRGINVAGKNKIKMADLREVLENAGLANVQTYIQSGNVLFDASGSDVASEKKVRAQIKKQFGCDVPVLVRPAQFFEKLAKQCPFPEADRKFVYVTLLDKAPAKSELDSIRNIDFGKDQFIVKKDVVYVFCPSGYARTKLNNQFFERKLKRSATTRNWKTVCKLIELASG